MSECHHPHPRDRFLIKLFFAKKFAGDPRGQRPLGRRPQAAADPPDGYHDDWLHVENGKVVDMDGNEVWMTGVNWFGYNVGSQIFDGAWSANVHDCLKLISDHGFNLLRVPMSTQIIL